MATFEDLESALKFIESGISASVNTLKKELKEEALVGGAKVYSSYSPRTGYVRRGSLINSSNYHVTSFRSGNSWEVEMENFSTGRRGIRLDTIIENASGGHWKGIPRRPWMSRWIPNEFKVIAEQIVRESLAKQGIL